MVILYFYAALAIFAAIVIASAIRVLVQPELRYSDASVFRIFWGSYAIVVMTALYMFARL